MSDFKEILILSIDFGKILKHETSWQSAQWEPSCSMRTDGQTGMTKLIVTVRNFATAPKITFLHNTYNFTFIVPCIFVSV